MRKFESAIKALGSQSDQAWEDIIANNNFKQRSKISKAGDVKGLPSSKEPVARRSIKNMTKKEYEEFKRKNLKGSILQHANI